MEEHRARKEMERKDRKIQKGKGRRMEETKRLSYIVVGFFVDYMW
jgi:hypothetical protein